MRRNVVLRQVETDKNWPVLQLSMFSNGGKIFSPQNRSRETPASDETSGQEERKRELFSQKQLMKMLMTLTHEIVYENRLDLCQNKIKNYQLQETNIWIVINIIIIICTHLITINNGSID